MKRPEIKDKAVDAYVKKLEAELAKYDVDKTIAGYLKASKKQIDDLTNVMNSVTLDAESLIGKDGKLFDRVVKLLEKAPSFMNTMIEARKHIKEIYSTESGGGKEMESGGLLEDMILK